MHASHSESIPRVSRPSLSSSRSLRNPNRPSVNFHALDRTVVHVSVTNNEDRPASRTRPSALTSVRVQSSDILLYRAKKTGKPAGIALQTAPRE